MGEVIIKIIANLQRPCHKLHNDVEIFIFYLYPINHKLTLITQHTNYKLLIDELCVLISLNVVDMYVYLLID